MQGPTQHTLHFCKKMSNILKMCKGRFRPESSIKLSKAGNVTKIDRQNISR